MDKEHLLSLMESTENDVAFAEKLSDKLADNAVINLDNVMREIQDNVIKNEIKDEGTLTYYLGVLTNAVYFMSTKIENFGFYDDIAKANARLKYNELYAKNQLEAAAAGKKTTQADNQLFAEMNSIDENMLSVIYSRSVKKAKAKLEAANEMIRTLGKLLNVAHDQMQAMRFANKNIE